jgi:hypothetical protein
MPLNLVSWKFWNHVLTVGAIRAQEKRIREEANSLRLLDRHGL